ncbi:hypothetical protein [Arthrobacter sp. UYEF3]|uniref:hypothetical protein n=1 Tax=Arthrobacter sp. UYEF3 TaxID=1756365 RepID=UPI003397A59D
MTLCSASTLAPQRDPLRILVPGCTAFLSAEIARQALAWAVVLDVARDPRLALEALETLAGSARHWTFVSSCSVYADRSGLIGGPLDATDRYGY